MEQSNGSMEGMRDEDKPKWFYKTVEDRRPNEMLQTQGRKRSQHQKAHHQ
eukprot:Gb_34449 [translate_table: standard]